MLTSRHRLSLLMPMLLAGACSWFGAPSIATSPLAWPSSEPATATETAAQLLLAQPAAPPLPPTLAVSQLTALQPRTPQAHQLPVHQQGQPELQGHRRGAYQLQDLQGVHQLPADYWAVQIAAVKDIEQVAQMVKDNQLQGMLGVPMNTEVGPLHAVLMGVFATREQALSSARNIPPALVGYTPWVRPLGSLQAAMQTAR